MERFEEIRERAAQAHEFSHYHQDVPYLLEQITAMQEENKANQSLMKGMLKGAEILREENAEQKKQLIAYGKASIKTMRDLADIRKKICKVEDLAKQKDADNATLTKALEMAVSQAEVAFDTLVKKGLFERKGEKNITVESQINYFMEQARSAINSQESEAEK
jgi:hypothetical protein